MFEDAFDNSLYLTLMRAGLKGLLQIAFLGTPVDISNNPNYTT